jgi:uncharacterized protein (TIGR02001 family)
MKPTAIATLLAAVFATASSHAASDPVSVVKDYMKTWSSLAEKRGVTDMDVNAAANQAAMFMDADVVYLDSTVGTAQNGIIVARDGVIKPFLTSFPNARWEMVGEPKVSGNDVEFKWLFTGNNYGPYIVDGTCPGKGDRLALEGNSKITVVNGLITYQNDNYDDKAIPAQLTRTVAACALQKAEETKKADAAKSLAITGNFMLASDYMFRGISVTQRQPAVQGGIDLAHPNGFYASIWASNVSEAAYNNGSGMELDVLAGMKWDIGGGYSLDTGLYLYNYPRAEYVSFTGDGSKVSYDTQEIKVGLNYDIYNATLWYGINKYWAGVDFDNNFAKTDTSGSTYLELNANPVIAENVTLNLHYGHQTVKGSSNMDFNDIKIGVTADAAFMKMPGWMASAAIVHNDGNKDLWAYADRNGTPKSAVGTTLLLTLGKYF